MDIHRRIELELRGVRAVWRRELARFDESDLSVDRRTALVAALRRRSLVVLAATAARIHDAGADGDELAALTELRAEIGLPDSVDDGPPILAIPVTEPPDERRRPVEPPRPTPRDGRQ